MKISVELQLRFAEFLVELKPHLDRLMNEWNAKSGFERDPSDFYINVDEGSRYIRLSKGGSVYAFIDKKNGDILKPATYKAPAKHARGNITEDDYGLHCCELWSIKYLR